MSELEKKLQRINRRIGQVVASGERETAREYAKILTEIRATLSKNFERFEQGGQLTLQEMLKHDRLTKLIQEIEHILRVSYPQIFKVMHRALEDTYLQGYYLTAWAIETESLTKLGYAAVAPDTMTAMLAAPVYGLTLNDRLEKQRHAIIYEIQQQITLGFQNNETYATMARRLKTTLEGDANKAMTIVRTEGHRYQESAKHDAVTHANKNGVIMEKTWNTLEDERVRPQQGKRGKANHKKLNGVTIPSTDVFSDGLGEGPAPGQLGAAGSDINCRCFLTYRIVRVERPQHDELKGMAFEKWESERRVG